MTLSRKQKIFVEEYLQCWNATEAAKRAGYSARTAYSIGWENLRKPEIAELVSKRLQESAMSADEVLMRLADHARSDLGDFISDDGQIDIAAMKAAGATHLLRKVKHTVRSGESQSGASWEEDYTEVELHDAQSALQLLGKHHKLFTEKIEHDLGEIGFTADEAASATRELSEWIQRSKEPKLNG